MTLLGEYLAQKSVNKADVSRKTGISKARISELTLKSRARLTVEEMYLIAMAIDVNPCDLLKFLCKNLDLTN